MAKHGTHYYQTNYNIKSIRTKKSTVDTLDKLENLCRQEGINLTSENGCVAIRRDGKTIATAFVI